jgi:hypothetical protein
LILLTIESGSVRMSGSGTERLCRPVAKYFRCWRSTGRACGGAGPSQFDPFETFCRTLPRSPGLAVSRGDAKPSH